MRASLLLLSACVLYCGLCTAKSTNDVQDKVDVKTILTKIDLNKATVDKGLQRFQEEKDSNIKDGDVIGEEMKSASMSRTPRALIENVNDLHLSASSSHSYSHGPQCARIVFPMRPTCNSFIWHARAPFTQGQYWIQVDLTHQYEVVQVLLQGRIHDTSNNQWVTAFRMATFDGTVHFHPHTFTGVADRENPVVRPIIPSLVGRMIRLYPWTYRDHPSLRWEIYGYRL